MNKTIGIIVCIALALGSILVSAQYENDYDEILHKSILFYEAQRSGALPANNRIPWRGDSALGDQGLNGEDLTGGWYDAGDFVKFNFPTGMATFTLLWSILEFKEGYEAAGEYETVLDSLRWPLDFYLKCHVSTNTFYGQIGDSYLDHNYWGRPEEMTMERPASPLTTTLPGSDLAGEIAAAFAAGYLVYRDSDPEYGFRLLDNARRLYEFAYTYRGFYSISIPDAGNNYWSASYIDELALGAAWLYRATGEDLYLARAREFANTTQIASSYDWDDKAVGAQLTLHIVGDVQYTFAVEGFLRSWFPGGTVPYTPKGLAWYLMWGSNRYAANSAFIALVAAKYGILPTQSIHFALSQINYILGDGGRSYVIGYGLNPPERPHHASSSCPDLPAPCDWDNYDFDGPNPQVLYGAVVGGPGIEDDYEDDRDDYVKNEVTCDYNCGFQSSIAGLKYFEIIGKRS